MTRKERITPVQRHILLFLHSHPAYFEYGHRSTKCKTYASGYVVQTNSATHIMLRERGLIEPFRWPNDGSKLDPRDWRGRWTLSTKGREAIQ